MNTDLKILLVEDNPGDATLIKLALQESIYSDAELFVAESLSDALQYKNEGILLLLLDLGLPDSDGVNTVRHIHEAFFDTALIVLTGLHDENVEIATLREGVQSYLNKNEIDNRVLEKTIRFSMERHQIIQHLKTVERKLQESNYFLERSQAIANVGSWVVDLLENTAYWSDEARRIFGFEKDMKPSPDDFFDVLNEEDKALLAVKFQASVKENAKLDVTHRIRRKDGMIRWVTSQADILADADGKPVRMIGSVHDITEKKEAEEKIFRGNRLYAVVSHISQAIVRLTDQQSLFEKACKIAVKHGKFKFAWIAMAQPGEKMKLVASCGGSQEEIDSLSDYTYETDGPISQVLNGMPHYLVSDVAVDHNISFRKTSLERGYKSFIVLPLTKMGAVIAIMSLHYPEINFFDNEEIDMLQGVAKDISFAIDVFEKERIQKETEELILKNEKRFRALIEKSTDMKTLTSDKGVVIYGSPSITKVLGYTLEEFIQISVFDFMHPQDMPGYLEKRKWVLERPGQSFYFQQRVKHKNGKWVWCENIVTNLLNEPGVNAMVGNFRDITEKKLADQQREFDRNNLHAIINSTHDLMWSVDQDFNLITSNEAFNEITLLISGRQVEKGKNVLSASANENESDRYKSFYKRAFLGEVFTEVQYNTSPIEFWSETSFYPIRKGEEIIGTACYSRNITERKLSEQLLRKSEAFSRDILNSLSSNIAVIDTAGNILAVNEAWTQFNISNNGKNLLPAMSIYSNYMEICKEFAANGEQNAEEILAGINKVIQNQLYFFKTEYKIPGTLKDQWFSMVVKKLESDEKLMVIAHEDISDRKSVEQNLFKSEARLKEAEEFALIGNWEINMVEDLYVWSDGFYKIFGIDNVLPPSRELFMSFIYEKDQEHVEHCIQKAFELIEDSYFNFRFKKAGRDELRHGLLEYRFVFNEHKKPIRLYGIFKDLTLQKNAEREREKILKDIIQRNKDLEQFAFIVSHNLRLPVANIIGFAEILKNDELNEAQKLDFMDAITTSVSKLDEVVSDLNHVLQVRREINEKLETVSFPRLVQSISSSIQNVIEQERVQIKTNFTEVEEMFTLKSYLHSVFYNLISNSIKYRQKDVPLVIEISSQSVDHRIILTFKDNGSGIDLYKNSEHIFGLYKRFHSKTEGKGMGLFMVKTQVETMGGRIAVDSEVNEGTVFTIEFEKNQSESILK